MLRHHAFALAVSLGAPLLGLLHGCGGGAEPAPLAVVDARTSANVRVEGCVVDEHFIPNEGISVRALSPDGQTLAYATSGRRGEVIFLVPSRVSVALAVDRAGGEWMSIAARDRDSVVESCLIASSVQ